MGQYNFWTFGAETVSSYLRFSAAAANRISPGTSSKIIAVSAGEKWVSRKLIIMGAAGRDFHVFNCCYRDNAEFDVVAFTATQIPHIGDRRYPASLAGAQYLDVKIAAGGPHDD